MTAVGLAVGLAISSVGAAQAQQFFDGSNTVANNQIDGGSGAIDGSTNFTNANGTVNSAYNPALASTTFGSSGLSTPASGGTVTITSPGGPLTPTVNFTATGDNSIYSIVGFPTTIAAGGTTFNVTNVTTDDGVDAQWTNLQDGAGNSITKTGAGTLELLASGYSGITNLQQGTLFLSNNASLGAGGSTIAGNGHTIASNNTTLDYGGVNIVEEIVVNGNVYFNAGAGTSSIQTGNVTGAGGSILAKTGDGTLRLAGTTDVENVSVLGGELENGGTVSSNVTVANGTLYQNSGLTSGTLSVQAGGTVDNVLGGQTTGLATVAGVFNNDGTTGVVNVVGNGVFNNSGSGVVGGAISTDVNATLNTTGTLNAGLTNSGTSNLNGGTVNGGIVNQGGNVNVNGTVSAPGTVTNNTSAQFTVNNGGHISGVTTFNNNTGSGTVVNAGGSLQATTYNNLATTTTSNFGVITVTNPFNNAGTLNNFAGGVLNGGLANSSSVNNGGIVNGGVTNTTGVYFQSGAAAETNGTFTNNGASTAVANGGSFSGPIVNNGSSVFQVGGAVTVQNSTFANNGSASLSVLGGGSLTGISTLTNSSSAANGVVVSGTGLLSANAITNASGAFFTNNGTTNSLGGQVQNAGTFTNNGNLGGGISNSGTFDQNAAGVITSGGITNSGTATVQGASNGAIANTGTFTIDGAFNANGANFTNSGTGTVQVTSGATTGINVLTNSSTANPGILVDAGTSISAVSIINSVNSATITNNGTVSAVNGTTNSGLIRNEAAATWYGGITTGYNLANRGAIYGGVNNLAGGFAANDSGAAIHGGFVNSGAAQNSGTINDGLVNNGVGSFTNNATGVVNGSTTVNGGFVYNYNEMNGGVTVNGGTFTTSDTVNGGLTNRATTIAQGTISGAIQNLSPGTFSLSGDLAMDSSFFNSGQVNALSGDHTITGFTTFTNAGSGSVISMVDGVVGTELTLNGTNFVSNGGNINLDINLGANNPGAGANPGGVTQLSDFVDMNANLSGTGVINFTHTSATYGLQDNPIVIIDNDGNTDTSTWTATGLPTAPSFVNVSFGKSTTGNTAGDWVVTTELNGEAIGGISGSFAAVQSVLDTVVQRASSFVSAPVQADDNECSPGVYMRGIGGASKTTNEATLTNAGTSSNARTSLEYLGGQGGIDFGCYNIGESDMNITGGLTAGYAAGHANRIDPYNGGAKAFSFTNDFQSYFYGAYGVFSVGRFFSDLQLRGGHSTFKLNSSLLNNSLINPAPAIIPNTKVDADSITVAGSAGYAIPVGEFQLVPAAGFSYTRTDTDTLVLSDNSTIAFNDVDSIIGYAGLTLARTFILDDQVSAVQPFFTLTAYNDFGDDPVSVFTDGGSGATETVTTKNIGTFFEGSAGANYLKLYEENEMGFISEINFSSRLDVRVGDDITSFGGTLQLRLKN